MTPDFSLIYNYNNMFFKVITHLKKIGFILYYNIVSIIGLLGNLLK